MSLLRYAAYGSNLHPERLAARTPSARLQGTAFLADRSLYFHKQGRDGSGKCNIRSGRSGVYVAVYTMTADEKPRLDEIEHVGIGYEVTALEIPGFGECITYVATESHIVDDLLPYCWYHQLVIEGCRYHDLPADYIANVSAVSRVADPDSERRQRHWGLLHALRGSQ